MTAGRARITGDRLDEPIRNMEFAVVAPPEMVIRQLVTDNGFDLLGIELGQQRIREHDMAFARHEIKRRVGLEAVLRLI